MVGDHPEIGYMLKYQAKNIGTLCTKFQFLKSTEQNI